MARVTSVSLIAWRLGARENPVLLDANLAVRGRKTAQIRAEQLEPALAHAAH